ncbi:MAG TPA: threonine synthase, partial [Verrucomicrobiaceae bacterium]
MHYLSTRGQTRAHSFSEAVEAGLAPDGGLFLPASWPDICGRLKDWERLSYPELAAEFLQLFAPEISPADWHELTQKAYAKFDVPEIAPLRKLNDKTFVLELFHGPTLAFKDFALQLLGLLYERQVKRNGKKLAVLGATSGDTGSAAIHGCLGQPGIRIFILYPAGRVAPLQERQMACTGSENVFAIPVPGTFDDAQRVVKECFADTAFAAKVNLSAVNSINIARILAQCVYYIWAWLRLPVVARASMEFVVPTGNFGNVLAGWFAQRMGLPVGSFRVATNQNDILYRFFTRGEYQSGNVRPSHAPSMDIQAASNFERFLYFLLDEDPARVRDVMSQMKSGNAVVLPRPESTMRASRMDDAQIERVISQAWHDWQYVVDPHTACAFTDMAPDRVSVVLATAHPAKFPEVVTKATGQEPKHPTLEALKDKAMQTRPLPATP